MEMITNSKAKARVKINRLLEGDCCKFKDTYEDMASIPLGLGVKIKDLDVDKKEPVWHLILNKCEVGKDQIDNWDNHQTISAHKVWCRNY